MLLLHVLFSSLLPASLFAAKILTCPQQLSNTSQYDFVVVGAGPGGSVVANRLTENPNVTVLLIEAGGSTEEIVDTQIPFLGVTLPGTTIDWNFTTTPQPGLGNRTLPFTRGQCLGGCSIINLMTWNRGADDVYDNWAELTGDSGWSANSMEEFYLKTSRLVPSADGHSTTGQVNTSAHGDGPVQVSLPGFPTEIDSRVLNASKELGGRFQLNLDLNAGTTVGFGFMQSSIGRGARSSAATAYLEPVANRSNLHILTGTHVTKLVRSSSSPFSSEDTEPHMTTVEMAQSPTSLKFQVTATKEVIVSAGAIGTPQLLLLSGIGPREHIQTLGIESLLDLPDVGQHLTEHPAVTMYFSVNSTSTFDDVFRNPKLFADDLAQWTTERQGLFVDSPANTQAFMRLPKNSSIFETVKDPSSGPGSAHTELIIIDGFAALGSVAPPVNGHFITVLAGVVSPTSRGSVQLASSDPFAKPIIDPGLLQTDFDIFAMVQAMKDAQEFLEASPWKGFVLSPFGDIANATTDAAKASFARKFGVTLNHPTSTARMSPANASYGVVDPHGVVKGASGLRVVDASVFPHSTECHTQGPTYTVAERIAHIIKEKYGI